MLWVLCLMLGNAWAKHENNACPTFKAYFDNRDENPECWYDPDVDVSPEIRAQNHDLLLERHYVHTDDNYILTTFRLKSSNGIYGKQPVYLQHAFGSDATQFTMNGNKSIAYFLAKQGLDVWMGNFRGSEFSEHRVWSRKDKEFWDFSIDHHGLQDLPPNLKYVKSKTSKKLIYIGHSMGVTSMAMYLSTEPVEAADLLLHVVMVSPTLYMKDLRTIAGSGFIRAVYSYLPLTASMNVNNLMATDSFERTFILDFCMRNYEQLMLCINLLLMKVSGEGGYPLSPERLPLAFGSLRNFCLGPALHYAQLIRWGEFRRFDYGPSGNLLRYNSIWPPSYDLSQMTGDMSWICGRYDSLATIKDCRENFERFKKPNWDLIEIEYNHVNFLVDNKYSDKTILPLLMDIINKAVLKYWLCFNCFKPFKPLKHKIN